MTCRVFEDTCNVTKDKFDEIMGIERVVIE